VQGTMSSTREVYLEERNALIREDRALRLDSVREHLTPSEIKADQVVRRIRAAEAKSIWSADHDLVPHPFPGMEFLTGG
jgi:adenosine deaminase CECR1